jgi:hypothetical protein
VTQLTAEQRQALLEAGQAASLELSKRDFDEFLNHVKILEPPPGRGIIFFERWPHLMEVCQTLEESKLIVWLKSRQTGASWLLAAYSLWRALFFEGAMVLLLSQGEEEAKRLLAKSRFIYEQLPSELKVPIGVGSRQELEFPSMHSSLLALPSTEKAGRSSTATMVVMDEADYHDHLDTNYAAVKPTIDDGGGQLIMVSTSNGVHQGSLFKKVYKEAPFNGFKRLFYGWNVRPGRDNSWYAARKQEYTDDSLFEKEYPATEDEALAPPRTIAAFNPDILTLMREDVRNPVEIMPAGVVTANIYQDFHPGKRYSAGTDTSHGTGGDDAVTVILDATTGYVVADIQTNLLPPDQLAIASVALLARYHNPVWGVEDNDWGVLTIVSAQGMRYPRLYYRDDDKPGWHTDERSRYLLWGELIEAVNSRLITIASEPGLSQFYSVIRNPNKNGRIEGQSGTHDDYPLAVGIAWQLRRYAQAVGRARDDDANTWRSIFRRRAKTRW